MKNKRKILSFILVVCIFASFSLIPYAESTAQILTTTEKAEVLNKLSILKGDGTGDYKLDNQLKRSEAAAFIIRLLGKESYVLENSDNYIATSYTDVVSSDWFAPYVGYCSEEGIIAGTGNNQYTPNAFTSEKAFLKLVLVSLGYEYGNDFSWSEVYAKAYEVKLVTGEEYLTKTEDNNAFTREGVVNVLYNALSQNKNGTTVSLIQSLINEGAVSKELAATVGLAGDTSTATITSCESIGETTILINFDRSIKAIDPANIKIYESADITKQLTATVLNLQNNILVLTT
ncbi:MAG: S-layer homology domain-containing protein, partial [Clostridiales bacterium]|nr:S-layer homology domain-containing protein [Clostridiales bacterium]